MRRPPALFIAATGQNVGKTTACLGILAGLHKMYGRVGFIKPVGQRHVEVASNLHVDKDAVLFKEYFKLDSEWRHMSPVILPSGFTRDFLDGKHHEDQLLAQIQTSYSAILQDSDYVLVEGTGHVGVGSIVNLCNARVAAALRLDMIIITSGGLGSAFDELALNVTMAQSLGVKVRGVILNRVQEAKRDMILHYFPKALKRWDIPLVGCIPYNDFLSQPTMKDFEQLFETPLLSGEGHRFRHFNKTRLVATSQEAYRTLVCPNQLVITPASREDIIHTTIEEHRRALREREEDLAGGMILTGRARPREAILDLIREVDIPILYANLSSYQAMKKITSFTAKILQGDLVKVEQAIDLVTSHVDFDVFRWPLPTFKPGETIA